jgi:hypothetical protein
MTIPADTSPGSWQDCLVEAYAGPHDSLRQLWYNSQGNFVHLANQFVTAVLRAGGASVLVLALGVSQAAPPTVSAPPSRTVTDD